jgi:type IV secretion system protein VirB10
MFVSPGPVAALVTAALLSSVSLPAQAKENFSGAWTLNRERSDVRSLPEPLAETLRIEHAGIGVQIDGVRYTTDRKETKSERGGVRRSTIVKWEGSALLFNTLVTGAANYTVMDRWKLSGDGQSLTIRRQVVDRHGEMESLLVYELPRTPRQPDGGPSPAELPVKPSEYTLPAGTRIPLKLINSVSTKHSTEGDRIYLQTIFPVMAQGRVVVAPGSHVAGTVTFTKRPGRVKGRGELFIRFDSLTLANGTTRDFRSRPGALDGEAKAGLEREEGKIKGESDKGGDARTVGEAASAGASVGAIAGSVAGRGGMGVGVGAAAGAAAGLAGVLARRGPDVVLPQGSTVEMVLDRELRFTDTELIP